MRTLHTVMLAAMAGGLPAQQLHLAVAAADVVAVATDTASEPVGERYLVHRLKIGRLLKGDVPEQISVVEILGVALHQKPEPDKQRLYCLHDWTAQATKAGLPAANAPYFKMSGHPGSNPDVTDIERSAACELALLTLAATGDDLSPEEVNTRVLRFAFAAPPQVRTEAIELIQERQVLLDALDPLQVSDLLSRAVGETTDIPFKIALAGLCAEKRVPGLVDALCISIGEVEDPSFARALGRIARHLHGEAALDVLRPHITKPLAKKVRDRLLLALGATQTERALQALLHMQQLEPSDEGVRAALQAHGARPALDAIKDN